MKVSNLKTICTIITCVTLGVVNANAQGSSIEPNPQNYLYVSADEFDDAQELLKSDKVQGIQVIYLWSTIETKKNSYDFNTIDRHLKIAKSLNKALFIQLQDRTFDSRWKGSPEYLLQDKKYGVGIAKKETGEGWIAAQWNDEVRKRYQKLITKLATRYDGKIRGLNLPETATDLKDSSQISGFSCNKYFDAEIENAIYAKSVFRKSDIVLYANFWPCEWANNKGYMQATFEKAKEYSFGLGGPDILPYHKPQMKNSYSFFNKYKGQLKIVALAVQEPDLEFINPNTNSNVTSTEQIDFARDYLGANIIFWALGSPWLSTKNK